MMRKYRMIVLIMVMSIGALAQVNYVPNGDFDTYHSCPIATDQIRLALGWRPIDTLTVGLDSSGNHVCSAEYFNECSPKLSYGFSIPFNLLGYQYAHSGKGMVGFGAYTVSPGYERDYIQSKLTKQLTGGKRYCVTFYVNLAEGSDWGIKEIGAYLDNGSIDTTTQCGSPQTQCIPQVVNTGNPITDTASWTKIEGSFIATGTEQFITIGNFRNKTGTTIQAIPSNGRNGSDFTYYFIDDVSVVESTTMADAGPDTHIGRGDSVYVGRPTSSAIWCDWNVLGSSTIIGKGPGIWVKPTITTSYVVTQTLCGVVTKDTVKVEVWAAGVQSINGQTQQYGIVPNPNSGAFELVQSVTREEQASVSVTNAVGQQVYISSVSFKGGGAQVSVQNLPAGLYCLSVQTIEGYIWKLRFLRE